MFREEHLSVNYIMGKIIAVCNQKGGTGKTTTAVNLSASLALLNKKTLLLDLDPQANATSGIGLDKYKIEKSTYDILLDQVAVNQVILDTAIPHLKLAAANLDLTGAEVELVGALGREHRLKKVLLPEKDNFDFIIIDSPPSLGLLTINGLCAADSVLIPVQCEYYALEGLTQLIHTINLVKNNLNPDLAIEGVVLTMADFRTNLTKEVIQETRNYFSTLEMPNKGKVFQTVIPRNIRLTEAPSFGKPIALYDRLSIGAQKYDELAREMLGLPFVEEKTSESLVVETGEN